jgi:hypothetical protein
MRNFFLLKRCFSFCRPCRNGAAVRRDRLTRLVSYACYKQRMQPLALVLTVRNTALHYSKLNNKEHFFSAVTRMVMFSEIGHDRVSQLFSVHLIPHCNLSSPPDTEQPLHLNTPSETFQEFDD